MVKLIVSSNQRPKRRARDLRRRDSVMAYGQGWQGLPVELHSHCALTVVIISAYLILNL